MAPRLTVLVLCVGLAGCGADEQPAAPAAAPATDLTVRVDPDGRGPADARELRVSCEEGDSSPACEAAAKLRPAELDPAAGDVACTDIFGGPETARLTGRLRGAPVAAELSRSNGCEIARWDAAAPLLRLAR